MVIFKIFTAEMTSMILNTVYLALALTHSEHTNRPCTFSRFLLCNSLKHYEIHKFFRFSFFVILHAYDSIFSFSCLVITFNDV